MAIPVVQSSSVATGASVTSITITKPAGTVEGDLLLAFITRDAGGDTIGAPAGFVTILSDGNINVASAAMKIARKAAGASEPADYTFDSNEAAEDMVGIMLRIDGHVSGDPVDVTDFSEGTSTTPISPDITTTVDNTLIISSTHSEEGLELTDDIGEPSGYTMVFRRATGTGGANAEAGVATIDQASAGATGTASWTSTEDSSEWYAAHIAIAGPSGPLTPLIQPNPQKTVRHSGRY